MRRLVVAAAALMVFVVGSCAEAVPQSPEEKVEAVVASMNAALGARDVSGFVRHVHPMDPELIEEWRYWAEASLERRVSRVSVRLGSVRRVSDGEVLAALELRWMLDGERVSQRIDARFTPLGTPGGSWAFSGREWVIDESGDGVRVLADEVCAEHASIVLERVPVMMEEVKDALGVDRVGGLTVKLYGSAGALQRSIDPTYTHPVSGWSEPGQSVKIHVSQGTHPDRLVEVLAHELGHFVSFAHGEEIRGAPWWVLEGAAELASDPYKGVGVAQRERAVAMLVTNGDGVGWSRLSSFDDETMTRALYVYTQGWSMVRYVSRTHGTEVLGSWFTAMGRGSAVDDATRSAIGIGFNELDREWRAHLRAVLDSEP